MYLWGLFSYNRDKTAFQYMWTKKINSLRTVALVLVKYQTIFSSHLMPDNSFEIYSHQHQTTRDIDKLVPLIDAWAITNFKKYPYLYVPRPEDVGNHAIFNIDPQSLIISAAKDGNIVGLLAALPLNSPFLQQAPYNPSLILDHIRTKGFNPDTILYICFFLVAPQERLNKPLIQSMYDAASHHARLMGKTQICYIDIEEDTNHPLRPSPYIPLEPWNEVNASFKHMDITMTLSWPTAQTDGSVQESEHTVGLFVGNI